jgi:hypothetical protein
MEFAGRSRALSRAGLDIATATLGILPAELWTVIQVETLGWGYLADRRPQNLFERHVFHRLTAGRFDDGDISDPLPGCYGSAGTQQYERLARAITLDRRAALCSASWGLGQVLGENFGLAGFSTVHAMVAAMMDSEDGQAAAMVNFIRHAGLASALRSHDWTAFARGYNGQNFAVNRYDERLAQAFAKFSLGPLPALDVRMAQLYLTFLGLSPGPVDGLMGLRTRAALMQFQVRQSLSANGSLSPTVLERLEQVALG